MDQHFATKLFRTRLQTEQTESAQPLQKRTPSKSTAVVEHRQANSLMSAAQLNPDDSRSRMPEHIRHRLFPDPHECEAHG